MNVEAPSAKSIFLAAIELGRREEWPDYIAKACGDDSELRRRVEGLLEAHAETAGAVDRFVFRPERTTDYPSPIEGPGTVIGPYKLMEQIGEGGMGVVYVAEQTQPVRRKVALKVIKPGMDTRQVVARFEAERQALAMMDHPNIARIFDGGITESGRPFFVMELVRGLPVTAYCDGERLSIRDRLELFVLVCRAVQHAHQKGIIHRDLKPSNILVTLHDGVPVPKVIDFGVAKATGQCLTEKTIYTAFTQLVGTPLYMSPEQVELSGLDIDTRSDIYSLGVLLYELLTGTTPFDSEALRKAGFDEMRRIIREDEPPTPSTRLRTLSETLTPTSTKRSSDPRHLNRSVRGELDWIAMKALEKDRKRRYETANDFAADVMRYLTDQPVEACPPSASYRLTKFARRNRGALVTVAVVSSALVLGTVVSAWQAIRATQANAAEASQRQRAEAGERQARANLKKAREAVDQMLVRVAGRLSDVPHMETVRRELLADSLKFYDAFLQDQGPDPEVRFETGLAYLKFAEMQMMLGEDRPAEEAYLQAIRIFQDLADRWPGNADYRHNLAHGHNKLGNLIREKGGRIAEAEQAYRRALAITRKLDADFPGRYRGWIAGRLNNIGIVLAAGGRLAEAERVHREALAIRIALDPNSSVLLESYTNLGTILHNAGRFEDAEQSFRRALEVQQKVAQPNSQYHQDRLAMAHMNLATALMEVGRLPEAESSFSEALSIREKLAADFPNIPSHRVSLEGIRNNLGNFLQKAGRVTEAETAYREGLAISERLTVDFPSVPEYRNNLAKSHHNLSNVLRDTNRLPDAESGYRRAHTIFEKLAQEFPDTPEYRHNGGVAIGDLGLVHLDAGQLVEAETSIRRSLAGAERLVSEFPDVKAYRNALGDAHANLGVVHYRIGDWKAAVASLKKGFELKGEHEDYGDAQFVLAMAQWRLGDRERAGKSYDQAMRWMDKPHPRNQRLSRFRAEATALLKAK